jgi:hypothetical protein
MKLILEINGTKLLLSAAQVETIADLLHGAEIMEHKYMGSRASSEYMDFIRPVNMRDTLKLNLLTDVEYDAMVFITKQLDESKSS